LGPGLRSKGEPLATSRSIAVVGAGSWGTALAKLLAEQGLPTVLWAREHEIVDGIRAHHRNPLFLGDVDLPTTLSSTGDLAEALTKAEVVVSAVPTQHIRSVFADQAPLLSRASVVVTVSKGIEAETLLTPHQILVELGVPEDRLVALSGPSFAREVAAQSPTAVVAAGRDRQRTVDARDLFSTNRFRVYSSDDVISVELGGALKNVVAIAAGVAHGLSFGHNTHAAIITRGLAEITRLGVAQGGDPLTFAGLSGIGDLVLTCTGDLSRNRSVGVELGRGRSLEQISAQTNEVAEGVHTSRSARDLGRRSGIDLPITEQVCELLFEGKNPTDALLALTDRALRDEPEHR
jgi:glycerol-3-phosphate dehydrogenase (NAD(P)+)